MKRILSVIMVLVVILIMSSGCTSEKEKFNKEIADLVINQHQEREAIKNSTNSVNSILFEYAQNFSENRAWVQYRDYSISAGYKTAVIDTQGQIIWESETTTYSGMEVQKFKDGVSYFEFEPYEKGTPKSYNIIDSDGNITFTENKDGFMILGYGNGHFLVAEHISDFNTNEWRIGAIDKYGNIVTPLNPYYIEYVNEYSVAEVKKTTQEIEKKIQEIAEMEDRAEEREQYYTEQIAINEQIAIEEADNESVAWFMDDIINKLKEEWEYVKEEISKSIVNLKTELETMTQKLETLSVTYNKKLDFEESSVECVYRGDNIFDLWFAERSKKVFLNIETQSIILNENDLLNIQFLTDYENGYATVLYIDPVSIQHPLSSTLNVTPIKVRYICKLGTDGLMYEKVNNNWTQYILQKDTRRLHQ